MGKRFWSYSADGIDFHNSEEEAREACEGALACERDISNSDGWSDDVTSICWGEVRERVVLTERVTREDPDPAPSQQVSEVLERFDVYEDYGLRPVSGEQGKGHG